MIIDVTENYETENIKPSGSNIVENIIFKIFRRIFNKSEISQELSEFCRSTEISVEVTDNNTEMPPVIATLNLSQENRIQFENRELVKEPAHQKSKFNKKNHRLFHN